MIIEARWMPVWIFWAHSCRNSGVILFHDKLGRGATDRQGVADLVGDAAGHYSQGCQFLGLEQLRLKFAPFRQVPAHGHDPGSLSQVVLHGGKNPGDRDAAAIPGFQVPLRHLGVFTGLEVGKDARHLSPVVAGAEVEKVSSPDFIEGETRELFRGGVPGSESGLPGRWT